MGGCREVCVPEVSNTILCSATELGSAQAVGKWPRNGASKCVEGKLGAAVWGRCAWPRGSCAAPALSIALLACCLGTVHRRGVHE